MRTLREICKEQTEMIDEMRQNIRELTKESEQYKEERDTLEAQKIAFARSYKQVVEENEKLKEEIKKLKGED